MPDEPKNALARRLRRRPLAARCPALVEGADERVTPDMCQCLFKMLDDDKTTTKAHHHTSPPPMMARPNESGGGGRDARGRK